MYKLNNHIMKKSLLISSLALLGFGTFNAQAQAVPNGGLENWGSSLGQPSEPTSWVTGNILAAPIATFPNPNTNPTSVFKTTTAGEFHGGVAAMKITTVKLNQNPLASSGFNDTVGMAVVGQAQLSPSPALKQGFPYTGRPNQLDFWYKYTPTGIDNGGALAILTKWTGSTRDTVAEAYFFIPSGVSAMSSGSVVLVYRPAYNAAGNPDTAIVGFSSSIGSLFNTYTVRPKIGSALWVDDVDLTGTHVGIKENSKSNEFRVFPNPATALINFAFNSEEAGKVELYDVTGKKVNVVNIEDKKARINTDNLANGLYIYRIMDNDKKVMATGKVNVSN